MVAVSNPQHPLSSTRNMPSRSERHGDTMQISRTPGGGPGYRRNDNSQRNQGQQSVRGNGELEVQQSSRLPHNRRGARPQGEAPPVASLHDTPTIDLRQKINDGHNARCIIEVRRRDRPGRYHDNDDNNHFPAFTSNITKKSYPKDFK
jgi:hypothetical protein